MTDLIQNYRTCKFFAEMLNITLVEKKKLNLSLMYVVPKSRHDLTSFTQNMNIKCREFFCQVVQKYIINNLVFKKRNCKPSWPVYSMFICYFLKQPPHNYGFTKWLGKKKAKQPPLHHRNTGKLYRKSPGFYTGDCGKQTRVRNDRTVHSLQKPTRTKH